MKHPFLIVFAFLVLAVACWLAWAIRRDRQLWNNFDKVKSGAPELEVLRTLGQPKRVERCGEFWGPLPKAELAECAKEYFYASPFSPLLPQYYVVRFDGQSRVTTTATYSSP